MANPQIKNGFTRIPNDILERLMTLSVSGTKLRIILTVLRYTYGFNREKAELSNSYLAKAVGVTRSNLNRDIQSLFKDRILLLVRRGRIDGTRSVISINTNIDEWGKSEKIAVIETDNTSVIEIDSTPAIGSDKNPVINSDTQEEKESISTDTNKEDKERDAEAHPSPSDFSLLDSDKGDSNKTQKYGKYGWVVLLVTVYECLIAEFNKIIVDLAISVVDERAQSNGNKHEWKDWELKVRQAIRDNWGNILSKQSSVPSDKQSLYDEYNTNF